MNTQRDFLHIPDGEAVTVTLKYNTGLLRNGQFGKYFIYTVVHNGEEKLLKVTERLEKQFRKQDLQGGQEIQLRKDSVTPKQGEPYAVVNLVIDGEDTQQALFPADAQSNTLPKVTDSADELRLLNDALSDARTICKNANDPSILPEVTLAVGLFLARTIRTSMNTRSANHRSRRFPRRTSKPTNGEDKAPVENIEKQEDDLPF